MGQLLAYVLSMIAAGYVLRKRGIVRPEAARDLAQIVSFLTLPPLIFDALHRSTLTWSLLIMPVIAWVMTAVAIGLGLLLTRALRLEPPRAGALLVAMVFGNTTFLGYPIVEAFYGAPGLARAIFYDLLGATMAVNTVGVALASANGQRPSEGAPRTWKRLLTFPPLWAMAAGLALHSVTIPGPVESLIRQLGGLTAPLIMLSLGLSLRLSTWRDDLPLVAIATAGRLVVMPALVWGGMTLLGMPHEQQQAAVIESGMPTMFYSLTLALVFHLRINLVVNAIMVSTLLSFVTLPLWRLVLG